MDSFSQAFQLPIKYLSKKKRAKLEEEGKSKVPAVGTSDAWWQMHLAKEEENKKKDEKASRKKILRDEKKKLADAKKELQKKMKEIQEKIKMEM